MSVTNTAAVAGPSEALLNSVNPKKATATDSVTAEQDKFMTLLVTQLKNQDPMNPLDNAAVTSQFAQLSTVTGVNKLNDTLESLKASYKSSESLQATSLINHGILSAGKTINVSEGKGGIYGVDLATPADSVDVQIFSPAGKLVKSVSLGASEAGTAPLAWDGKNNDGVTVPDGKYSFTITAKRGGEVLKDATALSFNVIQSVSTGAAGVKLNLPSGAQLTMDDIKQIL
ncbi:flagellar hook assembly protein FlgD [Pseudoduganella ginsengisoli]|uniref:Basal-body rod modification protein FlgD n=1 Tax=Pseudoduganella ginsengisoli TaxID=1462440 RepID=A0A6L6PSR3_9BURK|nr:flagellar hook assembly protein FlgD [Pseudoduganella ginsengisoli]MTW00477.1 flagellar biosynthesis protein FlgD [Pseudoduganella ginsengisoli]